MHSKLGETKWRKSTVAAEIATTLTISFPWWCHTGQQTSLSTLTFLPTTSTLLPADTQSSQQLWSSHTLNTQKTVQNLTTLSILQRHSTHPPHYHTLLSPDYDLTRLWIFNSLQTSISLGWGKRCGQPWNSWWHFYHASRGLCLGHQQARRQDFLPGGAKKIDYFY